MATKITLSAAVAEYMRFANGQGLKPNTIKQRQQSLDHLKRAVSRVAKKDDVFVGTINHTHIDELFNSNAWSATTHNLHRTILIGFFDWLRARSYFPRNVDPMYGVRTRKREARDHQRVPVDEWTNLFSVATHPMDRMILAIGLFLFCRGSEWTQITIGDIDLGREGDPHRKPVIRIKRQKTEEFDYMPVCAELEVELRRWLVAYEGMCGPLKNSWYLIPARMKNWETQQRSNVTGLFTSAVNAEANVQPTKAITRPYNYVNRLLAAAGYPTGKEGAHTLRRSGARALFDERRKQGYDGALREVQAMLGHASSITTEGYLGLTLDKMHRDEAIAGKPMFASLADTGVTGGTLTAIG